MKAEQVKTTSVRISEDVVQEIRINVAQYGGTIRAILEEGAGFAMGKNAYKNKKKVKK